METSEKVTTDFGLFRKAIESLDLHDILSKLFEPPSGESNTFEIVSQAALVRLVAMLGGYVLTLKENILMGRKELTDSELKMATNFVTELFLASMLVIGMDPILKGIIHPDIVITYNFLKGVAQKPESERPKEPIDVKKLLEDVRKGVQVMKEWK
jgi:hypothetical protein